METRFWFKRFTLAMALLILSSLSAAHPAYAFDDQAIKALTQKIATKLAHTQKNNVAVIDFINLEGGTTLLGRFLSEEVANALGNSEKNFEIVDRDHLNSILKENKLSANGFISALTTTKLGNMTGAQALITGTISPFGDSLRLTVKVLDTKTAKQIASESIEFAKTKALADMYEQPLPEEGSATAAKAATKAPTKAAKQEISEASGDDSDSENVAELQGIRLELSRCEKGGQSVSCHLFVESPSRDVKFHIHSRTRIFDEAGAEFPLSQGKIANTEGHNDCGGALVSKTIVAGVKTPVLLVFQDVGTKPKKLTSFELTLAVGDCYKQVEAHFRNITLAKAGAGQANHGVAQAGADPESGGGILDAAVGAAKEGVTDTVKSLFGKLRKRAKIPDPPPGDSNQQ